MEFPTINPKIETLIRQIKAWLLRFGERDNEGFYFDTKTYHLFLMYSYDLDGSRNYERFAIRQGRYVVHEPTEEQLTQIFSELTTVLNTY